MALVVEITVKINCSYPNLSEISPDIIVLHLFQELFLQGMTFSHSLPCKYKTVNRIHIPFPFIGELFFQRMKSQKKNNENNSNSIYNLYAMYNLNIFFDHHLLLSSKFQSLETFTHRNKIVTKLARNLDEESHSRLRASRKQTWAEGVVDKAVEISGRIIGVRLNWLDRGSDGKIQRRNFSPSQVYILNRGGGGRKLCEPRLFEKNLCFPCPPSLSSSSSVDIWREKEKERGRRRRGICSHAYCTKESTKDLITTP